MLFEQLDTAALQQLVARHEVEHHELVDAVPQAIVDVRSILTSSQRTAVANWVRAYAQRG